MFYRKPKYMEEPSFPSYYYKKNLDGTYNVYISSRGITDLYASNVEEKYLNRFGLSVSVTCKVNNPYAVAVC